MCSSDLTLRPQVRSRHLYRRCPRESRRQRSIACVARKGLRRSLKLCGVPGRGTVVRQPSRRFAFRGPASPNRTRNWRAVEFHWQQAQFPAGIALERNEMRKGFTRKPPADDPAPQVKNYITPGGLQRLKEEFRFLLTRERPAVTEVVTWAASNGEIGRAHV